MGFVTGFTGGVTLTLSIAYLSVLAHQRNRQRQGDLLRAQALAIRSLIDPVPQPLPPTRSEVAAAKRAEIVEVAKDRWNHEVESAVRWVQRTDWADVRDGLEHRLAYLWDRAFGESVLDGVAQARTELASGADRVVDAAERAAGSISSKTRDTWGKTQAGAEDLGARAKDNALQARLAAWREAERVKNEARKKALEADGAVRSALERGRDKAAEVVGKVRDVVGLSGAGTALGHVDLLAANPVQKALDQRFDKGHGDGRTVAELLNQRYTPMDERDNTVLRGL